MGARPKSGWRSFKLQKRRGAAVGTRVGSRIEGGGVLGDGYEDYDSS